MKKGLILCVLMSCGFLGHAQTTEKKTVDNVLEVYSSTATPYLQKFAGSRFEDDGSLEYKQAKEAEYKASLAKNTKDRIQS